MSGLTSEQLQRLKHRLDERENELRAELDDARELEQPETRAARNHPEDAGEQGEQRLRQALLDAEKERDVGELRDIAAARQRIDEGRYGDCVYCGNEIGFARLQAQPAASRCIGCQEDWERLRPVTVATQLPPRVL